MKIEKTLYEEAKIKCDCCGAEIFEDYYTNISGWDICKDCMAKSEDVDDLITLDNVLSYGASEKESVKINHLLYMLYDDDEVEEDINQFLFGGHHLSFGLVHSVSPPGRSGVGVAPYTA